MTSTARSTVAATTTCLESTCARPKQNADVLCPSDIYKKFGDAVVTLRTVSNFRVFWQDYGTATNDLHPSTHFSAGIGAVSTTGFFIRQGFIVSGIPFLSILMMAAMFFTYIACLCWQPGMNFTTLGQAVNNCCCPPTSSSNLVNNYQSMPGFVEVLRGICTGQSFADFFDFYAEVYNVNNCGENISYRAFLVGLDFETGVGIYRIEHCDEWNQCLPRIKKQKYLMFGNSKCYTPGNTVHTIADSRCTGARSYSKGVVVDNTHFSRQGDVNYESLATNLNVGRGSEGAPVLNDCGLVVGIVTGMTECCNAIAVSSSFIAGVVDAILEVACFDNYTTCESCNPHAVYIDLFGCICYRYGTIQWSFRGKTALDINQMFLQTTIEGPACKACCPPNNAPPVPPHPFCPAGADPCANNCDIFAERFYTDSNCQINRHLVGIIIDTEPCGQLAEVVEACTSQAVNYGRSCTDIVQIQCGDIVTHINANPLGMLPHQNTPANILYNLLPCDCVTLSFQKLNERYTQCHTVRVRLEDSLCWIGNFKPIITACLNLGPALIENPFIPSDLTSATGYTCFIQQWSQLLFWLLNTIPQVYRASFFTNLSAYMTTLNTLLNNNVYGNIANYNVANPTDAYPLQLALVMSNISRTVMTYLIEPSIQSCYRPASFVDYISSFQHPNTWETFSKTLPDYFNMGLTNPAAVLPAAETAARAVQSSGSGFGAALAGLNFASTAQGAGITGQNSQSIVSTVFQSMFGLPLPA